MIGPAHSSCFRGRCFFLPPPPSLCFALTDSFFSPRVVLPGKAQSGAPPNAPICGSASHFNFAFEQHGQSYAGFLRGSFLRALVQTITTDALTVLCSLVNVSFPWLYHLQWLKPASSRLLMWESPSLLSRMTHHRDEFLWLILSGRLFLLYKSSVLPMQNTAESCPLAIGNILSV